MRERQAGEDKEERRGEEREERREESEQIITLAIMIDAPSPALRIIIVASLD